jgi:ABC-type branched-subunit amino acid transport system substrate-binding protein
MAPSNGGLGWIGPHAIKGRKVAEADIEDAGGVLGRSVSVTYRDTKTNPSEALSAFDALVNEEVSAIIGPSSSSMPKLINPIRSAQVPLLSTMAGTLQLNDVGGKWIWRTIPSDSISGRAQGQYALEKGNQSMGLAFKNEGGSQSFSASVGDYFKSQGGTVETKVPLDPSADSYEEEVQQLIDAGPNVVSLTAATEVSKVFVQEWAATDPDIDLFLGNDVVTQSFIETVGADTAAGLLGQSPAPGPNYSQFNSAHQEVHGQEAQLFGAEAYDALNIIALAAEKAGAADRVSISENIRAVGTPPGKKVATFSEGKKQLEKGNEINYHGAGNPQDFNKNGDPVGPFAVLQVQGGEWTEVEVFESDQLEG